MLVSLGILMVPPAYTVVQVGCLGGLLRRANRPEKNVAFSALKKFTIFEISSIVDAHEFARFAWAKIVVVISVWHWNSQTAPWDDYSH